MSGAGILIIPEEASFSAGAALEEALVKAMTDPLDASSVVPLIVRGPASGLECIRFSGDGFAARWADLV